MKGRAIVVGAGPNGLSAAIVLAQARFQVKVLEAEPILGGAARTLELTLPGFLHDFGSAVHPMAAGSPFLASLPLHDHGLAWIHSPAVLAHPLDDGTAIILQRSLSNAEVALDVDGSTWRSLFLPFVNSWKGLAPDLLGPLLRFPKHPWLMARFGMNGLISAKMFCRKFKSERTRALFAGLAAHSFLGLDDPLSAAFGLIMAILAHSVGWPIARGGSQAISNALSAYLATLGGSVKTSSRVENLSTLEEELILCDVTPHQLLTMAGNRFSRSYMRRLQRYRYGPGVFKVDYALRDPIPWRSPDCLHAATVHLGGSFGDIAMAEQMVRDGQHADRPFVLLAQPSLFDPSRAPEGKHTAWAYCHVPNGSNFDMLARLEDQIERFAPGFRECVLARRTFSPAALEAMDANLVGGDIVGGAFDLRQSVLRPTWRSYATSARDIFMCSASTPPGGGVHGMCGYNAARAALAGAKFKE